MLMQKHDNLHIGTCIDLQGDYLGHVFVCPNTWNSLKVFTGVRGLWGWPDSPLFSSCDGRPHCISLVLA